MNPIPEVRVQELVETSLRKSLEGFLWEKNDEQTINRLTKLLREQLAELAPPEHAQFEVKTDADDSTKINIVPGNAWTALTLSLMQHCPDSLPVPLDATEVVTPIGKFSYLEGVGISFMPILPPRKCRHGKRIGEDCGLCEL
jgi:hypothetical protein